MIVVTVKRRVPVGPNDARTAKTKLVAHTTMGAQSEEGAFILVRKALADGYWVSVELREEVGHDE